MRFPAPEAAKPGFGIEAEDSDSLAGAVLRELSGVAARASKKSADGGDKPATPPEGVTVSTSEKKEAPKKRSNELEGQMDLFSMMGL